MAGAAAEVGVHALWLLVGGNKVYVNKEARGIIHVNTGFYVPKIFSDFGQEGVRWEPDYLCGSKRRYRRRPVYPKVTEVQYETGRKRILQRTNCQQRQYYDANTRYRYY